MRRLLGCAGPLCDFPWGENHPCPDGGIGRHARLRIWFRKECRFKSCSGYPLHFLFMTAPATRAASRIRLLTWDEDEVIATAKELRAETGGATIAFAYVSADWRPHISEFVEILQVEGHARCVVGCSADGIIGTGEEDENVSGFSVLFLNLPDVHVSTWMIDNDFQIPHGLR